MQEKKFHRESVEGVDAVFGRMWEAVGRPLFTGYAQAFDVSENDIKNWRRRGRVSRAYLEGFSREHGVSLDWLLYGDQPKAEQAQSYQVSENLRPYGLSADEAALLETYREIDPETRVALQSLIKVIAGSGQVVAAPKPASSYKPRQHFGVGAQPGKVRFQTGQEKRPLTTGKAKPAAGKKTKKENE